jgi:hypothetical protein
MRRRRGSEPADGGEQPNSDDASSLFGELGVTDGPADGDAAPSGRGAAADETVTPTPMWARRASDPTSDDWFSMAEPASGSEDRAVDAPASPSGPEPVPASGEVPPPGPVTPAAPFALTWGEGAPDAEVPAARFSPPRAARRSFTPPFDDSVQSAPPADTTPSAGAGGPVDDYGAAVWSALTEPEEPAKPADPVAGSDVSGGETATESPPARTRPPFPAFAAARWGDRAEPPAAEPVDDLFAALGDDAGGGSATSAAAGAGAAAASGSSSAQPPRTDSSRSGALDGAHGGAAVNGADGLDAAYAVDETGDLDVAGADTAPGFAWNLTPDPTAPDPAVAAEAARRRAARSGPADGEADDDAAPATIVVPPTAPVQPADAVESASDVQLDPTPEPQLPEATRLLPTTPPSADQPTQALPAQERQRPEASADGVAALFGGPADDSDPWRAAAGGVGAAALGASLSSTPAGPAPAARPPAAAAPATASAPAAASAPRASGRTQAPAGPGAGGPGGGTRPPAAPRGGPNRTTRTLIWVAGGLVVLLVLAGLYFLGTQLGGGGTTPAAEPTPAPSATPTPTPDPTAPQPAGVHAWDTLFGGECLDPFQDPWAEEFTVVDCAAPHAAQLVLRAELPVDAAATFPGEAALGEQTRGLCTAPGVIDVGAASGIADLQVQGTYPVTEEQWAAGERTYYCFVNRAGGEPLTASLQGPGPAA